VEQELAYPSKPPRCKSYYYASVGQELRKGGTLLRNIAPLSQSREVVD
jgi:hypothetical protein